MKESDAKTFSFIIFVALTLPLLIGGAVATALTGVEHRRAARGRGAARMLVGSERPSKEGA